MIRITFSKRNVFISPHPISRLQPKVLRLATLLATSAGLATETDLAGSPKGLGEVVEGPNGMDLRFKGGNGVRGWRRCGNGVLHSQIG